jgi:uncharacterized protein
LNLKELLNLQNKLDLLLNSDNLYLIVETLIMYMRKDTNSIIKYLKKGTYFIIGAISLVIGIVGLFLPLIPTTPLVLLSAWCFFRSSSRIYEWVISNEKFGPTIKNYQEGKGITKATKIRAIVMMWLTISLSIYFYIRNYYVITLLYAISTGVTIYLYKLPTLKH